jgi:hypothetical protein
MGRFPRVTHPSATPVLLRAFDLHVLGLPPAFVLSQDQTLKLYLRFYSRLVTVSIDESQAHLNIASQLIPKGVLKNVTVDSLSTVPNPERLSTRKEYRRPRFSFFRFKCQTA